MNYLIGALVFVLLTALYAFVSFIDHGIVGTGTFLLFVVIMTLFVLLPVIGDGNRRSKNDDI